MFLYFKNKPFYFQITQITKKTPYTVKVICRDCESEHLIGETEGYNLKGVSENHRYLNTKSFYADITRASIAHTLKQVCDTLCGRLQHEELSGLDLISFHIQEGYVPYKRNENFENLVSELAEYRINKTVTNRSNLTLLKYNLKEAEEYWQTVLQEEQKIRNKTH